MTGPMNFMYLRPGNLWKDFVVEKKTEDFINGDSITKYEKTENLVKGILANADTGQSERMKHRWDQDQHSLTHTIVSRGTPFAKKGDKLILGDRVFLVLLVDDPGSLGINTIYYVEERNDVK